MPHARHKHADRTEECATYRSPLTVRGERVEPMKKTVLFFHQSAELYGSDKVLLNLVIALKCSCYQPIVLLPCDGPLVRELASHGIETHVLALGKVSRATLSAKNALSLPIALIRSNNAVSRVLGKRKVALVHSNTLAVLSGAAWAKLHGVPHLWHVHEILLRPRVVRKGFPLLLRVLADRVVCNSKATERWIVDEQPALADRTLTIWNGVDRNIGAANSADAAFAGIEHAGQDRMVTVALVGRVNSWKGHLLLVEAANLLWRRGCRQIRFLMAGDVFGGQTCFLERLKHAIAASPAQHNFQLLGFTDSIWRVWDSCDIAVVPSTEPEPFGLVAIEAMCAGKPVVAAAHGGLLDILTNEETGLLVRPGDAQALANAIARLAGDALLRKTMGENGRRRQQELFSLQTQVARTIACYDAMTSAGKEALITER